MTSGLDEASGFTIDGLIAFRHEARVKTWAAGTDEFRVDAPQGFKRYEFRDDAWGFSDTYCGNEQGGGQEIVTFLGVPVWSMGYFGSGKKECFPFLREALRNAPAGRPRGPDYHRNEDGSFVYLSAHDLDISRFVDVERVMTNDNRLVWLQHYHGGLIVPKQDTAGMARRIPPLSLDDALKRGERQRLPRKRKGFTQDARISGQQLTLRTGEYEDGQLGEIALTVHKEGAGYRALLDCFAIAVSLGLQHGVPLNDFIDTFTLTRFEPQGPVDHPNVKMATSPVDYVFRVLALEYLGMADYAQVKPTTGPAAARQALVDLLPGHAPIPKAESADEGSKRPGAPANPLAEHLSSMMGDAPFCSVCGNTTVRSGVCFKCPNCGNTMGEH